MPSVQDAVDTSWDEDINQIHRDLCDISRKRNLEFSSEWEIWDHVPQYGYRMCFKISVTTEEYTDELIDKLNAVSEAAKDKDIEISVFAPYFYQGHNSGSILIYSTFLDKKRQKIKKWPDK